MPRLSLIIPVHNTAKYLEKCFASIAAQTLTDIEVIAVDDGSTDDSWAVIQAWTARDPRFRKSVQTQHKGLSCARNQGLGLAEGEFVAFIDSDDYIDARYCELPYLLATKSNADVVIFGSYWEMPDKQEIHPPRPKNAGNMRQTIVQATASVWDKHFRLSFLNKFGFQFINLYHEDLYATPQILVRSPRVAVLDAPLYHYVRRGDSVCGLSVNPRSADQLQVFGHLMELSDAFPAFRSEVHCRAIGQLRATMALWAQCTEPWAMECLERAEALLVPLARVERENAYLHPPVGIGKRIERALRPSLRRLRNALGLR